MARQEVQAPVVAAIDPASIPADLLNRIDQVMEWKVVELAGQAGAIVALEVATSLGLPASYSKALASRHSRCLERLFSATPNSPAAVTLEQYVFQLALRHFRSAPFLTPKDVGELQTAIHALAPEGHADAIGAKGPLHIGALEDICAAAYATHLGAGDRVGARSHLVVMWHGLKEHEDSALVLPASPAVADVEALGWSKYVDRVLAPCFGTGTYWCQHPYTRLQVFGAITVARTGRRSVWDMAVEGAMVGLRDLQGRLDARDLAGMRRPKPVSVLERVMAVFGKAKSLVMGVVHA